MKKWNDWKQESLHLKAPEAIQFVQNLSFPFKCQGLLFFNSKTFESYKLVNKTYQEYFDVRGNIPSVSICISSHSWKQKQNPNV